LGVELEMGSEEVASVLPEATEAAPMVTVILERYVSHGNFYLSLSDRIQHVHSCRFAVSSVHE